VLICRGHGHKNNIFFGRHSPEKRGPRKVHFLVEHFTIIGVQLQYWMLIALLMAMAAIGVAAWLSRPHA
jgi:hypothetical protein